MARRPLRRPHERDAQQTDEPIDAGRPDYLYGPLGDRGTRGPFGAEAKARSLQLALANGGAASRPVWPAPRPGSQ